ILQVTEVDVQVRLDVEGVHRETQPVGRGHADGVRHAAVRGPIHGALDHDRFGRRDDDGQVVSGDVFAEADVEATAGGKLDVLEFGHVDELALGERLDAHLGQDLGVEVDDVQPLVVGLTGRSGGEEPR